MTPSQVARAGWLFTAVATAAGVVYALAGRGAVWSAAREGRRSVLRHLQAGVGELTPADAVAAADAAVLPLLAACAAAGLALAVWPRVEPRMAHVYDAVRGAALDAPRYRTPWFLVAGAAVLALASLASVAVEVLQAFPNSGDEACYLYQAETFASGRLSNPADTLPAFFEANHIREVGGRRFSVFPPGWPAVLAAALVAGLPTWLVNPLLGLVILTLTYAVGRRAHDPAVGLVAAFIVGLSPFFVFNAASYFAHAWCAVLVLAYAWCGLRALQENAVRWAAAAGVALGAALLTRNYTAVLAALPFGVALAARRREGLRLAAAAAAGVMPFVALTLAYNHATMGHPLAFAASGLPEYDRFWFPQGWPLRGLSITLEQLGRFVAWTPPVLLVLAALAWRDPAVRSRTGFVAWVFPALVAGYLVYVNRGGNQYGPRFYFEALPFAAITGSAYVLRARRFADQSAFQRLASYLLIVSLGACLPLNAYYAWREGTVIAERSLPFRLVADRRPGKALVFLAAGSGWRRPMSARDLTRNDPDRANDVLYVIDRGSDNARLSHAFPGRQLLRFRLDPSRHIGVLEPLPTTRALETPPASRRP